MHTVYLYTSVVYLDALLKRFSNSAFETVLLGKPWGAILTTIVLLFISERIIFWTAALTCGQTDGTL